MSNSKTKKILILRILVFSCGAYVGYQGIDLAKMSISEAALLEHSSKSFDVSIILLITCSIIAASCLLAIIWSFTQAYKNWE